MLSAHIISHVFFPCSLFLMSLRRSLIETKDVQLTDRICATSSGPDVMTVSRESLLRRLYDDPDNKQTKDDK